MFKVLQLSSDFQYQKLYPNLVRALSEKGISQIVFIQKRDCKIYSDLNNVRNVDVVQTFRYKWWMKFRFKRRVELLTSEIEDSIDIAKVKITMAYFLFSDGAVANQLYKRFRVPFVVAIRNSDINHYFKYRFWLTDYIKDVLKNSSKIIFPSPSYINSIKNIVGDNFFFNYINSKVEVIGNIVHESWFDGVFKKELPTANIRLLYAGEFSKNKRIDYIISAFDSFKKNHDCCSLYLVGNYGNDVVRINKLVNDNRNIFVFDKIEDAKTLISLFDTCHIFIMPSKAETFGNVYVEAMARGLPIIYTKGQGIDGYFQDGLVGYSVSQPLDEEIQYALEKILQNYDSISSNAMINSRFFSQNNIAEKYIDLFKKVIK